MKKCTISSQLKQISKAQQEALKIKMQVYLIFSLWEVILDYTAKEVIYFLQTKIYPKELKMKVSKQAKDQGPLKIVKRHYDMIKEYSYSCI